MSPLLVNGKEYPLEREITVDELLKYLDVDSDYIVVELNGQILSKDKYSKLLNNEDRIEIVSFVGGG